MPPGPNPTAAIVLIGNELLSGKIVDQNAAYALARLRDLGVTTRRVAIVPDEEATIGEEVVACAAAVDHVFTSGGIGPTHDDITLASLARAFDTPLRREPELEAIVRAHFGARLTDDHLRMAEVPAGTILIHGGEIRWPVLQFRNLYVLPGIPEIFRVKLDTIAERFRTGAFTLRSLYLYADEGTIAALLRRVEAAGAVAIGSYPRLDAPDHRLRITVEGKDADAVNAAVETLRAGLDPGSIVRIDPPAR